MMKFTLCLLPYLLLFSLLPAQWQEKQTQYDSRGLQAQPAHRVPQLSPLPYSSFDNPHYWKNKLPHPGYWQQDIHYSISAKLNPQTHLLIGSQNLLYHNNSPDTLRIVYFQLPPGKQASLQVRSIRHDQRRVRMLPQGNALKVFLHHPLAPGRHADLQLDFVTHFTPEQVDRSPRRLADSAAAPAYLGQHWYPRIAPYHPRHAWQVDATEPDFGTFDVRIELPASYFVVATAELINEQEVLPDSLKKEITLSRFQLSNQHFRSPDSLGKKTWVFQASHLNDFSFVADPRLRRKVYWLSDSLACIDWAPESLVRSLGKEPFFASRILHHYQQRLGPVAPGPLRIVHGLSEQSSMPLLRGRSPQAPVPPLSEEIAFWLFNNTDTSLRKGFARFFSTSETPFLPPNLNRNFDPPFPWQRDYATYYPLLYHDSLSMAEEQEVSLMFHHLQSIGGEGALYEAIGSYLRRWQSLRAEPEDFREHLEQAWGCDLSPFFKAWERGVPFVDYRVGKVERLEKGRKIRVSLHQQGASSLPLSFRVRTQEGDSLYYHIPRFPIRKKTEEKLLPPWPQGNDSYQLELVLPGSFDRLELDPRHVLLDANRLNNHSKLPLKTRLGLLPSPPEPSWGAYRLRLRPNFWWNGQSGLQAGLSLQGYTRIRDHQLDLGAWYNSGLGQVAVEGLPEAEIHPWSYRFAYATPLRGLSKVMTLRLKSQFRDGAQRHRLGLDVRIPKPRGDWQYSLFYQYLRRDRLAWRSFLLQPDDWSGTQANAFLQLQLGRSLRHPLFEGHWRLRGRASFLGSESAYSFLDLEGIQSWKVLKKLKLRTRLYARYGRGQTPLESQLYLSGGSPEEMYESDFYRAHGFFPEALSQQRDPSLPRHFHFGGGLNLRAYSGWRDQGTAVGGAFRAENGFAVNAELSFAGLLPQPARLLRWDVYGFYDGGRLAGQAPAWAVEWEPFRQDAGLGLRIDLADGRFFQPEKPLSLRLDIPLWMSLQPQDQPFAWLIAVGKAF
jgi:hypothetical protein